MTITIFNHRTGGRSRSSNRPLADGGWVATHEDITERRRTEEQIAHLAHYDALTDLPNRIAVPRTARSASSARIDAGEQLAVLYIDIDEFKASTIRSAIRSAMSC